MEINVATRNGQVPVTVIYVNSDIDSTTSQDFRSKIDDLISHGARHILVDLSNVAFVSSAGLRALHKDVDDDNLRKKHEHKHVQIALSKSCQSLIQSEGVFELGGFDTYIETHHDINKAVNSF